MPVSKVDLVEKDTDISKCDESSSTMDSLSTSTSVGSDVDSYDEIVDSPTTEHLDSFAKPTHESKNESDLYRASSYASNLREFANFSVNSNNDLNNNKGVDENLAINALNMDEPPPSKPTTSDINTDQPPTDLDFFKGELHTYDSDASAFHMVLPTNDSAVGSFSSELDTNNSASKSFRVDSSIADLNKPVCNIGLISTDSTTNTFNMDLSTTDSESDRISPELFCLSHMSPTEIYGKDHTAEYQRLYSRHSLFSSRSSSTLNTPDPVMFEDSNSMDMHYGMKCLKDMNENPVPYIETDLNNNDVEDNGGLRGTKRKSMDSGIDDHVSKCPISDAAITSIINQGPPPDISTWRAVSSSHDLQGTYRDQDQNSQWIKPRCVVTPFQTSHMPSYSQSVNVTNNYESDQQEVMYSTRVDGHPNTANTSSLLTQQQQSYMPGSYYYNGIGRFNSTNHYTQNAGSCNKNQQNSQNMEYRHYQAAYRLDFSSPVNFLDNQGVVNFVSHQPYSSVGLARPRPLHPNFESNLNPYFSSNSVNIATSYPANIQHFNSSNSVMNSDSAVQDSMNTNLLHDRLKQTSNMHTLEFARAEVFQPAKNSKIESITPAGENPVHELDKENERHNEKDSNNNLIPEFCVKHHKTVHHSDEANKGMQHSVKSSISDKLHDKIKDRLIGKKGTTECTKRIETPSDATVINVTDGRCVEDLDCHSNDEPNNTIDKELSATSETFAKVQNKYFTEIYLKTNQSTSPVTSFCNALDLSKKQGEKGTPRTKTILPKTPLYGEPQPAVSSFLNTVTGPTLAYSHGMLVPYMNSIFAAMANVKTVPPQSMFSTVFDNGWNSQHNISVLTGGSDPILNQHSNLYSSNINVPSGGIAAIPSEVKFTSATGLYSAVPVTVPTAPKVNMNQYPLPLYTNPVQYPIRPLVTNNFSIAANGQRIPNTYLCRYSIGLPTPSVSDAVVSTVTVPTDYVNNNTAQDSVRKPDNTRDCVNQDLSAPVTDAEDPLVAHPITLDEYLNMSIQGNKYTSTVQSQKRGLTTYQPTPLRGFYCDSRKTFKAKHFMFSILQIGTYMFKCNPVSTEKLARVKILFSKKRFVYEFQLDGPVDALKDCEDMVCIEIPFSSIVGLWLFKKDMRLEVNQTPKIYLGKKSTTKKTTYLTKLPLYSQKVCIDITQGQLATVPYHYIQFRQNHEDKIKTELRQFDQRFETLLNSALVEDPAKSLKPATRNIQSKLLDPSVHLPVENMNDKNCESVYVPDEHHIVTQTISCCCTNGCSTRSCQCCVKGTTCTEGLCSCENCRNPLNILHQLGLPADRARTDPCLMENIYQIRRLDYYLKTQITLECCKIKLLLFNCIPGLVQCPYCPTQYKYSWCFAQACNEQIKPRNHCIKCGRCTDHRNAHCKRCNICYFAGENNNFQCPACKSGKKSHNAESSHRRSHHVNINTGLKVTCTPNTDPASRNQSHDETSLTELNSKTDGTYLDDEPECDVDDSHGDKQTENVKVMPNLTDDSDKI